MRPYGGWILGALLFVLVAFVWSILSGVTGRKPDAPSGPYPVRFQETALTLAPRETPALRIRVRVGVSLPQKPASSSRVRDLPLLIYAPGWGAGYDDNTALIAALASHGYGVVAIDDIARDPKAPWAIADDENARFATFDIGTQDRQVQFVEDANRRVALAANKVRDVIDAIMSAQTSEPLFQRFDLDSVGMIGASFGGATAAEATFHDRRIRAAINLDGLVFGRASGEAVTRAYMEFNSSLGIVPLTAIDDPDPRRRFMARISVQQIARQQRQLLARPDAYNVTVSGTRHSDYTDLLYGTERILAWRPFRDRPLRPTRVRAIIDDLAVTFFNAYLRGDRTATLMLGGSTHPEVQIERGVGHGIGRQ